MITEAKNKVDTIFLDRIKKAINIIYPFADYTLNYVKIQDEKEYPNGIYLHFNNAQTRLNCLFHLCPEEVTKMVFNEYYTPLHNEKYKKGFEEFLAQIKKIKLEADSKPVDKSKFVVLGFYRINPIKFVDGDRLTLGEIIKCFM